MSEKLTYNVMDKVTAQTDFNGNTVNHEYDVNGRLVKKVFPDKKSETYTYTSTGKRKTVMGSRGSTVYDYDSRDRLIKQTNPDGTAISYAYDAAGNRTELVTPSGKTSYEFDELNRLVKVIDPSSGNTVYKYDAAGNRSEVSYPNKTLTEYTYDSLNRLTGLVNKKSNGDVITSYTYTLAPNGLRLKVTENNGRSVDYTYDSTYKLLKESINDAISGSKEISYSYDAVGNRLVKDDSGVLTKYVYDDNDRLVSEGINAYRYDNNGNTIEKTNATESHIYAYDYENRLIKVDISTEQGLSTVEYAYDADGMRIQKVVDGTNVSNYLVDTNRDYGQVLEERDSSGNLIVSYTYGDDLISQKRGISTTYYHYDGLGSTRALTNDVQDVTDTYTYDAFGILTGRTGTTVNEYLYAGEQFDVNIGFYYLRARYMNPEVGRFITTDPHEGSIYDPATLHKYTYANNSPLNYIDPSGEFFASIMSAMVGFGVRMKNAAISIGVYFRLMFSVVSITARYMLANIRSLITTGQFYSTQLIARANQLYPKLVGQTHLHHIIPKYICRALGIPIEQALVRIPAPLHQLITNSIRVSFPFGNALKNYQTIPQILNELLRAYERVLFP
ncbi:MAG: hypothetical protein GX660_24205 [Clostridiaceae bacterium]|nr:hypothetical protein [Clostridiaceae bacterium]